MKIAIDFDGTCVYDEFPDIGKPVPHCINTLHRFMEEDFKLFLFTMRSGKYLEAAVEWFRWHGIFLDGINQDPGQSEWTTSPKCFADVYIDDSAIGAPLIDDGVIDWLFVRDWIFEGNVKVKEIKPR